MLDYMENKVVHIRHGTLDFKVNGVVVELSFMYKSIIDGIIQHIHHSNKHTTIHYLPNGNITYITKNDILIWIGPYHPDFTSLRMNGTYVILYNSEPIVYHYNLDEVWTYSKYIFNLYPSDRKVKFIPVLLESTPSQLNYLSRTTLPLVFLGNLYYRQEKLLQLLKYDNIRLNIIDVYHLWSDHDYNHFMHGKSYIFLNLCKTDDIPALPSVRINKLLSHQCIIISEHTNDTDDALYKDLVYFCNLDEVSDIYAQLTQKSNEELQEIASSRYELFKKRFCLESATHLIECK
jgi:hypothetical protein